MTKQEETVDSEQTFADYGVRSDIVRSLADAGITHPFPIQAMTLPVALKGHDIIGQAKTGTGKTLGFGIPLLQRVVAAGDPAHPGLPDPGAPQALVVVPTRELAVQVEQELTTAARHTGVRLACIYGGRSYEPQIAALKAGVEVVVGTPGRLLDLAGQRILRLGQVRTVVLDEADRMLDLGFVPDIERLVAMVPQQRHTMLFSATMPGPIVALARRYMNRPTHIRATTDDGPGGTNEDITQVVYRAHSMDKIEVLARALQARDRGKTIIFTRTKRSAGRLVEELTDRGFSVKPLHGDLNQDARERAMKAFRSGGCDLLVATDVAARGIDVDDVTHVVNYECPDDEETYVHRIGRTGRAGNSGTSVTFVDWEDMPRWKMISKSLGLDMPEPVETYSTSPHLFEDLGIPTTAKGRMPRRRPTSAEAVSAPVSAASPAARGEAGAGEEAPRKPKRQRRRRVEAAAPAVVEAVEAVPAMVAPEPVVVEESPAVVPEPAAAPEMSSAPAVEEASPQAEPSERRAGDGTADEPAVDLEWGRSDSPLGMPLFSHNDGSAFGGVFAPDERRDGIALPEDQDRTQLRRERGAQRAGAAGQRSGGSGGRGARRGSQPGAGPEAVAGNQGGAGGQGFGTRSNPGKFQGRAAAGRRPQANRNRRGQR